MSTNEQRRWSSGPKQVGPTDKLHPLRVYRDEHGLSRRGLADKLGVSEMSVWRWESGQLLPKRGHWAAILKVTGIRPEAFIPHILTGVGYDR